MLLDISTPEFCCCFQYFFEGKKKELGSEKMAEEEGFEPPRDVTPLSVFKTDPFSRTWVFLRISSLFYHSLYYFDNKKTKEFLRFFIIY